MPPSRRELHSSSFFEYTGESAMSVIGPVTGKLYRFDAPGTQVAVDLRDKGSIMAIPHLRRVG